MRKALSIPILLGLLAGGCAGPSEPTILGQWNGTWTNGAGGASGSLQITFSDKRKLGDIAQFDVAVNVSGGTCVTGGDFASGDRTAAFLNDDINFAVRFAGAASGSDEGVYRFDGFFLGVSTISGSYRLTSGACPQCTCGIGGSGTWSVSR